MEHWLERRWSWRHRGRDWVGCDPERRRPVSCNPRCPETACTDCSPTAALLISLPSLHFRRRRLSSPSPILCFNFSSPEIQKTGSEWGRR
ncbi:unnamed protein product [Cuscuta campestris]|uniref:Uncharacterized protein n=1 Tax=Cuscuta campestris TaxID=132261 RepID=A0A484NIB6_9ASTE|nr:unnamed protein product [Cuscuta campestris]